jgi:hypothetical protein
MDIAHIRSGSRAATVRRIHSAIHRFKFDWNGLDACRPLVGCRRERPLSRGEPRNGMAARRFRRANGKEFARPRDSTLAANGGPSTGNVRGDPSVRAADRPRRMAATDPDRRQSLSDRVRHLPVRQPTPSEGVGAHTTDPTGALVLRRGNRPWRGTDARTNLSRSLQDCRPRQRTRGSGRAHKRQSEYGHLGLRCSLCRDDHSRRILGVFSISPLGS